MWNANVVENLFPWTPWVSVGWCLKPFFTQCVIPAAAGRLYQIQGFKKGVITSCIPTEIRACEWEAFISSLNQVHDLTHFSYSLWFSEERKPKHLINCSQISNRLKLKGSSNTWSNVAHLKHPKTMSWNKMSWYYCSTEQRHEMYPHTWKNNNF